MLSERRLKVDIWYLGHPVRPQPFRFHCQTASFSIIQASVVGLFSIDTSLLLVFLLLSAQLGFDTHCTGYLCITDLEVTEA